MKTNPWTLLPLACALLCAAPAGASLAERYSLAELAGQAERVVVAHVVQATSAWDESGRRIVTTYELVVDEEICGTGAPTLRVVQPGGVVGRWAQKAHGYPTLRPEEPLLLFLEPRAPGSPDLRVVGLSQGVFALESRAGEVRLRQRLEGLTFPGASAAPLELGWAEALVTIRDAHRAARVAP